MFKTVIIGTVLTLCLAGYYLVNYWLLPPPSSIANVVGLGEVQVGDNVEHPRFGRGLVKSIRSLDEANDFILTVSFESVGKKNLMASAANLKHVAK